MWIWLPVPVLYATLALLLRAEQSSPRDERQVWIWKPISTILVILVCALSLTRSADTYDTTYTVLILIGLALSLLGDLLLIPVDNPKAFLFGLVAFLSAHLIYISAFIYLQLSLDLGRNGLAEAVSAAGLALVGGAVYNSLRPGLGDMRLPVIGYILVISAMVHRALAIAWVHPGPGTQPLLITAGALLFYLSDAILAINKFRLGGRMPYYKVWNLSTYYTGQLLLALSASFFP
jgi:uncharacterized membrane protein YhhN